MDEWNAKADSLKAMPRYVKTTTDVLGPVLEVIDGPSFYSGLQEIFCYRIYEFRATRPDPLVIDAGPNVGLSVLFFKRTYPGCRVIAFEADPAVFAVLERNVRSAGLAGVELVNRAVWNADGPISFSSEGADAGHLG